MSTSARAHRLAPTLMERFPVLLLLNPGRFAVPAVLSFALGLAAGMAGYFLAGLPLWSITGITLLAMLPVGVVKWRADRQQYGWTVMLLSVLLIAQGVHTIEHLTQWSQYYLLLLPARQSNGLVSAANAEWVHFVWNWLVLIVVLALVRGGMRNIVAILLLLVAGAHAVEHSYTFFRYQQVLAELHRMDVFTVTAQGLPGIVGRDGWLARSPATQNTFLCTLPGITTATRLDVHFWWNLVEMLLLLGAGSLFLRGRLGAQPR